VLLVDKHVAAIIYQITLFIFFQCIEVLGMGTISLDTFTQLGQVIHEKLEKHAERQAERHGIYTYIKLFFNIPPRP